MDDSPIPERFALARSLLRFLLATVFLVAAAVISLVVVTAFVFTLSLMAAPSMPQITGTVIGCVAVAWLVKRLNRIGDPRHSRRPPDSP